MDHFDRVLKNTSPGKAPPDLLERCLSTIPGSADGSVDPHQPAQASLLAKIAGWLRQHTTASAAPVLSLNGHKNGHSVNGHVNGQKLNGHNLNLHTAQQPKKSNRPEWLVPAGLAAGLLVAGLGWLAWQPGASSVANTPAPPAPVTPPAFVVVETPAPVAPHVAPIVPEQPAVQPDVLASQNPSVAPQPSLPAPAMLALPSDNESLVKAQIAAGEYAPALETAKKIDRLQLRDHWLGQIAVGQFQNGQIGASLDTTRQISDDRTRADVISQIAPVDRRPNAGGAAQADFQSLIDLITSTVSPDTWDTVGGRGSVKEFPTGVYINTQGVMRRKMTTDNQGRLRPMYSKVQEQNDNRDVRSESNLRKVSLTRLEREIQLRKAMGVMVDEEMKYLAGLRKIDYVMVYPESNDIVLVGPAGDWDANNEGRIVSTSTGRPVLQLDDFVVLLRHLSQHPNDPFGCLIAPREENLVRFRADAETNGKRPLERTDAARQARVAQLSKALGRQDIEVFGNLDARTRVAQVLVEADYRMKLVGIGLDKGTIDVPSCLDLLKQRVAAGGDPPDLDVLRMWFTLNYQAILANEDHTAFQLRGPGVQVLTENQVLTEQGQRLPTGNSDPLYKEFAANFSRHFDGLAAKYPVYADLQNVCDLAMVAALIESNNLGDLANWHRTLFGTTGSYEPTLYNAPTEVDTVANYVEVSAKQVVFVVSGGVRVNPWTYTSAQNLAPDHQSTLTQPHTRNSPRYLEVPLQSWWWD